MQRIKFNTYKTRKIANKRLRSQCIILKGFNCKCIAHVCIKSIQKSCRHRGFMHRDNLLKTKLENMSILILFTIVIYCLCNIFFLLSRNKYKIWRRRKDNTLHLLFLWISKMKLCISKSIKEIFTKLQLSQIFVLFASVNNIFFMTSEMLHHR